MAHLQKTTPLSLEAMETKKDYIILSPRCEFSAEEFRNAIHEVARTIAEILRLSNGCDIEASYVANKTYVLDWLLNETEIKDTV